LCIMLRLCLVLTRACTFDSGLRPRMSGRLTPPSSDPATRRGCKKNTRESIGKPIFIEGRPGSGATCRACGRHTRCGQLMQPTGDVEYHPPTRHSDHNAAQDTHQGIYQLASNPLARCARLGTRMALCPLLVGMPSLLSTVSHCRDHFHIARIRSMCIPLFLPLA
jgi:hypothetical protein